MPRLRLFFLVLVLGVISGCSSTFLYNQLDWLIPWYADEYVDFTREQNKEFKARLLPLLEWHRGQELENYLQIVDRIEQDLQGPVTQATVQAWANEMMAAYERLEARALPMIFATGASMNNVQMAEFMENLYKEQGKLEEEYLGRSEEEYVEQSYDNMQDNLADILGKLSQEQKALLLESASELQRFDEGWLDERRRWLDKLASILLDRAPDWEQQVRAAIAEREAARSERYSESFEYNQRVINRAIASVLDARDERQDKRLMREIKGIREDLQALIAG